MKKIILFTTLLALSSCVSYKQENLNLNLAVTSKFSNVANNKSISLTVVDDRPGRDELGQKRLGENLITIKSDKDLVTTVKNKIAGDLEQKGFIIAAGGNYSKALEVRIVTLNYNAYREFFTGTSKIEVLLKISARNKSNTETFSTMQSLNMEKTHFIMPLITTDEKTINEALQGALDGISGNEKVLEFLKR